MNRAWRPSSEYLAAIVLAALLLLAGAPSAWGQITSNWTNAAGGTFNVGGNWSAGVPGAIDTAFFNNASPAYTVTFSNSPSNTGFSIASNLALTFTNSGGPQTYTITEPSSEALTGSTSSLTLTGAGMGMSWTNSSNTYSLTGGFTMNVNAGASLSVAKQMILGSTGSTTSFLNVDGSGSSFTATSTLNVGSISTTGNGTMTLSNGAVANTQSANLVSSAAFINRTAIVNVQSGSTWNLSTLNLGVSTATGNTATLTVDGASSSVNQSGASTITIGVATAGGTLATLNVDNSGVFNSGTGAATINATGTLNIGGGTFNANGNMTVQGGGDVNLTSGSFNLAAGRTLTVSGAGTSFNHAGSSFTLNGAAVMNVTGASSAALDTTLNLGTGGTAGTLTVSSAGATSTVTQNAGGSVQVGANGILNVLVGGAMQTGVAGFSVQSGGQVNVTNGALTIAGQLTNLGTMTLTSGTIDLNAAGFIVGGTVSASAGTFDASGGSLAVSSGSFTTTGTGSFLPGSSLAVSGTGSVNLVGGVNFNAGQALTVQNVGASFAAASLGVGTGGSVSLSEGLVQVGAAGVTFSGGSFAWSTGTVRYTSNATLNGTVLTGLLGAGQVVGTGKHLEVQGTATMQSSLTLGGGTFSAGTLTGGNLLAFNSGTLNITNSGLTLGSGGTLGSVVNVASGMTINQTAATANTINGDGRLVLSGGTFNTTGTLTNNGEIQGTSTLTTLGGTGTLVNNSTILGTGRIEKNLTNNAAGSIQATGSDRLVFNGTTNTNAGRIDATTGGQIEFRNALTNAASTGLITGRDATLRFNAGLTNNGSMAFSNGTMDVFGDIQQNVGGRITISGGGVVNFYDDVTIASGANSVQASAGGSIVSSAVFFGSYNGGITGGGTAFIEGDHRPGNSPGLVTFGGDVFYGGLSTLHIELGGLARGSQYDAIDVVGEVNLAGALDIALINGFVPGTNNSFLIINNQGSDAVQGTFAGLAEGAQFASGGGLFQISYQGGTGNDVILTAVPEPATFALFGLLGGAGVGLYRWRRQRRLLVEAEEDAIEAE